MWKILTSIQTDASIYIVTERLTPLAWYTKRKSLAEETLKWGLYSVAVCKLVSYAQTIS